MASRQLTGAALTAKMIKKRLTALYPRIKFSVKSSTFSMGNSVDIHWTDGLLQETVNAITTEYQHGNFDGMQDIYNYKSIDKSLGCDGAKYVHCSRTMSAAHKAMLAAKAREHYGSLDPDENGYYNKLSEIEKMFFSYPEAVQKSMAISAQGSANISDLEMKIIKDIDTRDNSEIYVVKIITKVGDFHSLRKKVSSLGGYYSRFKRGFIFKEDPTAKLRGGTSVNTEVAGECA